MQFSVSSLVALALSLSLASAAPATSNPKRDCNTVDVQFEGADITQFTIPVCADGNAIAVGYDYLSISHISYDRIDYHCTFTAEFDQPVTPATAAYACNGNVCDVGPPQPVYTVACGTCSYPYCDGYSV